MSLQLWSPIGFCSGWGYSHYLTFDGTSYTFLDNCTSVLMREIQPRHGNLSILAHSYYCGVTTDVTYCPRALSVYYNSMEIVLTVTTTVSGKEESLVSLVIGRTPTPHCKHRA